MLRCFYLCAEYKTYVREMIWSRITKLGGGSYQCQECGLTKTSSGLTALKNHVESKHLTNLVTYSCDYCNKVLNTANAYHQHLMTHK